MHLVTQGHDNEQETGRGTTLKGLKGWVEEQEPTRNGLKNHKTHQKSGEGYHRSTGGERLRVPGSREQSPCPFLGPPVHRPSAGTTEESAPGKLTRVSSVKEENLTSMGHGRIEAPEEACRKEKKEDCGSERTESGGGLCSLSPENKADGRRGEGRGEGQAGSPTRDTTEPVEGGPWGWRLDRRAQGSPSRLGPPHKRRSCVLAAGRDPDKDNTTNVGRAGSGDCLHFALDFLPGNGDPGRGGHWRKNMKHEGPEETTMHCTAGGRGGNAGGQRTVTNRGTDPFSFQKGATFSCHDVPLSLLLGVSWSPQLGRKEPSSPDPGTSQASCPH